MNQILLFENDFCIDPDLVVLDGRRASHIRQVLRAKKGDRLRVGVLNARSGTAEIAEITEREVHLKVGGLQEPPPGPSVTLVSALPRPKILKRVLQAAAVFGVANIILIESWRVEKSFWQSPALRPEALREQLLLGLEQGGDPRLPEVSVRRRFKPFVQDELPALIAGKRALLAHPSATTRCPSQLNDPFCVAVGPEGGFISYEVEQLEAIGFAAVSLGNRILRVDQAVPALLGRLIA